MKRALKGLGLAALTAIGAARAGRAQAVLYVANAGDTVAAATASAVATVPVRFVNNYCSPTSTCYYYATQASFTVFFDPALVEVLGVQPAAFYITSSTGGGDSLRVNASGSFYGHEQTIVNLQVRLRAGAGSGAYLWIRPYSAQYDYCYSYCYYGQSFGSVASRISQVCHATQVWGDVDASGSVDSRDALITLSAAVGLPVAGGFDLPHGDVDGDGLSNSRDALMMLSYAIGMSTSISGPVNRVGAGIADVCPGLTPPGETVVFKRNGPGAGLYSLDSTATTPAMLAGSNNLDDFPRLDATGTELVFQCDWLGVLQLCRSDLTGAGRRYLDSSLAQPSSLPDWSPGGGTIAFLQGVVVSLMDSSGANRVSLGGLSGYRANGVAWSRDSTRLAVGSYPDGSVATVTLDTTHVPAVLASISDADQVRWSPDDASVLFSRSDRSIWSVRATGGTSQPLVALQGGSRGFDVGPRGILFTATGPGGDNAVWLLTGGPSGPIVRLTSPPAGSGDVNPSFRRYP